MAKVSAHGEIIGTVDFLAHSKRYMSDGVILKNSGFGWKLYGKVKPHVTPREAFEHAQQRLADKLAQHSALACYRQELHSLAGLSKRWKLHTAVQTMPDDPDGVWSEACDSYGDNVHADVDEIVKLCALYKLAAAQHAEGRE